MGLIKEEVITDFCPTFTKESDAASHLFIRGLFEMLSSINHRFQLSWPRKLLLQTKCISRKRQELESAIFQPFCSQIVPFNEVQAEVMGFRMISPLLLMEPKFDKDVTVQP